MADISLVKQLSGSEALTSLLEETRKKLRMNGRFQPHMAYAGYRAEVTVKFYPAASFIPPVEQEIEITNVPTDAVLSQSATIDETVEIPLRSPNAARESAEMPTPYLTQDANGNPVEAWKKTGKVPKNKTRGGETGKHPTAEGSEPAITMVPTAIPVA
jgi:hypothetical protein